MTETPEPFSSDFEQDVDAAWETEIEKRIAAFDAGELQTIPLADTLAELRRIAPELGRNEADYRT